VSNTRLLPLVQLTILLVAICFAEVGFFQFASHHPAIPDGNTLLVYLAPGVSERRHVAGGDFSTAELVYCISSLACIGVVIGMWAANVKVLAGWLLCLLLIIFRDDFVALRGFSGLRRSILIVRHDTLVFEWRRVSASGAIVALGGLLTYLLKRALRSRRPSTTVAFYPLLPETLQSHVLSYESQRAPAATSVLPRLLSLVALAVAASIVFIIVRDLRHIFHFYHLFYYPFAGLHELNSDVVSTLTPAMVLLSVLLIGTIGIAGGLLFRSAGQRFWLIAVMAAMALRENVRYGQLYSCLGEVFPATLLSVTIFTVGMYLTAWVVGLVRSSWRGSAADSADDGDTSTSVQNAR